MEISLVLIYAVVKYGPPAVEIVYDTISGIDGKKIRKTREDFLNLFKVSIDSLGDNKERFECILALMAKLTQIDGGMSKSEFNNVSSYLKKDCDFNRDAVKWGLRHFIKAAKDELSLKDYVIKYYNLVDGNYDKCYELAYLLMALSHSDGIYDPKERAGMRNIVRCLNLPMDSYDKLLFEAKIAKEFPCERKREYGSGFIITSDGFIITNYHVVKSGEKILVRDHEKVSQATLISYDDSVDLCLLKIDGQYKPLHFASKPIWRGQQVFTIGFPEPSKLGHSRKIAKGHISSTLGCHDDYRTFQIDLHIFPGNSGGPLIDIENGNVVGVIKAKHKKVEVQYAIHQKMLLKFIQGRRRQGLLPPLRCNKGSGQPLKSIIQYSEKAVVQIITYKKEKKS